MRRILAVLLFALVCTTGVHAQAVLASGAIAGLVKDVYGDGIPECTITLTNKTVGARREAMTSDDGIFAMPGLLPAGNYDLKVTRRGYADWELASFDLALGETLNFSITLYADKAATPEEAMRSIPSVQDSKISVSTTIDDQQLFDLPTQNQQLDALVLLAPAVVEAPDGTLIFRGEPWRNVFYLDGISVTSNYFAHTLGIAPFVMQETAGEMQVISSSAPTEFTHSGGGIVNAISKTGINRLHASAYDYYAQDAWNSPDFFSKNFTPSGRLNHAGVSVGLPVSTDSLFLFGNMERINESSEGQNRILNPLLTTNNGNSVATSNCTATADQCSAAASFLTEQMNAVVPQSQIATIGFARMDYRASETNTFSMSGAIDSERAPNSLNNATVSGNGGLLASNATTTDSTRFANFGWTRVFNSFSTNEFHADWFRNTQTASTNPTLFPASSAACPACGTGPVAITIAGTTVGGNPAVPYNVREQRYGGTDIFTRQFGTQTIRGGIDVWVNQDTMDQLYARYGQYNYPSLTAFAQDFSFNVKQLKNYSTFDQTLGNSDTALNIWSLHGFVQDTWRPLPKLTITAGLNYEFPRLPQPTEPNPGIYQTETIPRARTDFSPRIGIAYLLDKRTVVRVGGGSYYEPYPGELIRYLWMGGGIFQSYYELTPNEVGSPVFPKALPSTAPSTLAGTLLSQFFASAIDFRNPYSVQANFSIERRVNRWVSAVLSYVQSGGERLFTGTDINLPGNTQTSETYTINNAQGQAVNTYTTIVWNKSVAGQHWEVNSEGGSRYRAGTAQIRTAPLFGLSAQASYTWSHAYDDVSGPPAFAQIPSTTVPGIFLADWGNSAFDQRNRAVVNLVWQPAISKRNDALSRYVLNGWVFGGIATYASTMYESAVIDTIGQQFATGTSAITMDYTTTIAGTDGWNRVPFVNPGTIPIGKQFNVDVKASKWIPFGERLRGQLSVLAFNVSNHQNVSAVNNIAYTAVSGVLNPVPGVGTPIASYGYPYGSSARRVQVEFRLEF